MSDLWTRIQDSIEAALNHHGIITRRPHETEESIPAAERLPGEGGEDRPDRDMGQMHPQVVERQAVKPQPAGGTVQRGEEEKG